MLNYIFVADDKSFQPIEIEQVKHNRFALIIWLQPSKDQTDINITYITTML